MSSVSIAQEDLEHLLKKNIYQFDSHSRFISRCIDGRYKNDVSLPSLAMPGADVGEMAVLFATANKFGFEIDGEKAWKTLVEVIGGDENIRFHTDSHAEKNTIMGGTVTLRVARLELQLPPLFHPKPLRIWNLRGYPRPGSHSVMKHSFLGLRQKNTLIS